MANTIELSQDGLGALNAGLDKLVASMDKLERSISRLGKNNASAFDRVFGSVANLNQIVVAIRELKTEGVVNFEALSKSLRSTLFFLSKISEQKTDVKKISALIKAISTFTEIKFETVNVDAFVKVLPVVTKAVRSLAGLVAESAILNKSKIGQISSLFSSYTNIIQKVVDISATVQTDGADNFAKITTGINTAMNAMGKVAETAKTLSLPAIIKVSVIFGAFQAMLRTVVSATNVIGGSTTTFTTVVSAVKDITGIMTALSGGALSKIAAISIKDIVKMGLIFYALQVVLRASTALLDTIFRPESLANIVTILNVLGNALTKLASFRSQISGIGLGFVFKIGIIFGLLSSAFSNVANFIAKTNGLTNLGKLAGIFEQLGQAITALFGISNTLNGVGAVISRFVKLQLLLFFFKMIAGQFASVANALQKSQGLEALDMLSKIFDRLGRALRVIGDADKFSIGFKAAFNLFKFLAGFAVGLRVVNALLPKNAGKLDSFAGVLASISKLIAVINSIRLDVNSNVKDSISSLGAILKIVNPIFDKLKAFRNKKLPDLGSIFQGLISFAEGASGLDFSKIDLGGFRKFVDSLVDGLNGLDRVKGSQEKLSAINGILLSLGKISQSSGQLNLAGQGAGESISDGVKSGILRADFSKFLGGLLLSAIQALNPISLGIALANGIRAGFGAISEFKTRMLDAIASAGTQIQQLGQNLQSFGGNLYNSLGLGGLFNSGGAKLATDFDALSTQVKVFGNLTDEQTKKAQAFANEIGIKYPQSANDALQGIVNLQKAGLDLNAVFDALPAAADLASVSDTKDLDAASKALIQVTQSFKEFGPGIQAGYENANVAADILARSANQSTASVESLVEGLGKVGPVASTFGLDLQETTAVLSIFEDRGIKGAEAGTQLKSLLTNLTGGSKETRDTLRQLGVTLTDSQGNYKDLNTIVNELNKSMNDTKTVTVGVNNLSGDQKARLDAATKAYAAAARQVIVYNDGLSTSALDQDTANKKLAELQQVQANAASVIAEITGSQSTTERITKDITRTQAQNAQAIKKLAGSYGQAGLSILINAGDDAIKNFIESTGRLPTAAEQASLMLDDLKGDSEQLKGSLDTLVVRGFLPLIGRAFRPLVQLGRTVVDFFNSLPDSVFDVASNVILLVSSIATLVSGFSLVSGIALQFSGALISGIGVLLTMGLNMGLVVGAVAGLVASFATLIVVGGAIAGVLTAAASGVTYFFNLVETNAGGAGDAFRGLKVSIRGILDAIGDVFKTGGDIISFVIGSGLTDDTAKRGKDLSTFFNNLTNSIELLRGKVTVVRDFMGALNTFLRGADLSAATQLADAADVFGRGSFKEAPRILSEFDRVYRQTLTNIGSSNLFKAIFGKSASADDILKMFNSIRTTLFTLRGAIVNTFAGLSGVVLNALGISDDPKAKAQLKSGLSVFGSLITEGLQKITGIDLSSVLLSFKAGNLANGAKGLLSTLLAALRDAIFTNEGAITDVLSTIFGFFVPGKSLVPLLLDTLGLSTLADQARSIFDTIDKVFRAGVGTIFDILRGQDIETALLGNFGQGVQPVIRAVKSFGNAIGNITGLFNDLFAALFPSGVGTSNPGGFLGAFFDGVANVVDGFNNIVITPLRASLPAIINLLGRVLSFVSGVADSVLTYLGNISAPITKLVSDLFSGSFDLSTLGTRLSEAILGSISGILTNIPSLLGGLLTSAGDLFGSPFLTKIGNDLLAGDVTTAVSDVTTVLLDVINKAISAVPNLLIDVGTTFGIPLFSKLGEGLKTGDFTGLATTIADTVGNAVRAVPDLIIDLGTALSSPLLTKIGQDLLSADPALLISDVTDAITNAIKTALNSIPTRLTELGTILKLDFLKDITVDPAKNEALKGVIDTITRFVQLPLDTLKSVSDNLGTIVTGVKGIFEGTNPQGAENLKQLGIALGVVGGVIALLNLGAIIGVVTTGLSGLFGALMTAGGALVQFAGIGAILLIIKNAISGLADIFNGKKDVGTAIRDFFFNIGLDALKLFGLDKVFGISLESITTTWNQLFTILRTVAERVLGGIGDFFRNIIDGIQVQMSLLQARINIASPDQATRTAAGATFALNDILGAGDITNSLQAIQGALETGMNSSVVKAAARLNFGPIDAAFAANISNLSTMAQPEFNGLIASLASADRLDEAIAQIPPGGLTPFLNKLLTVDPKALQLLDPTQLTGVLQSSIANGSITLDLAKAVVMTIPDTVLTPAQKEAFIKTLQTDLTGATPGTGTTPAATPTATVETTVGVAPKPTMTQDDIDAFNEQQMALITGSAPSTPPTPIPVDQPVTPQATLDANGITSPDSAQAMADNLVLVQEQIAATIPQINLLTFSSTILSGVMNALVNSTLNTTLSLMDRLRTSATAVALEVPVKLGIMAFSFMTAGALAAAGLNPLVTKLDTIKTKITDIANALGSLQGGGTNVNTGTVGITPAGGRAEGGSVFAGKLYEVAERGISELLQIGGKTFLIPGQNGTVVPPVVPPAMAARGGSSVVNNASADNSIGNVTIVIQGGSNLTPDQLKNNVAEGMREYQRSNPINRRLLLAGKA